MIEVIKTYTGRSRNVLVRLAYRCTVCERIWEDQRQAYAHECKGLK